MGREIVGGEQFLPAPQVNLAQGFHDARQINAFGAAGNTGEAGGAHPDGLGFQGFIKPQLHQANDLVGSMSMADVTGQPAEHLPH